MRGLAAVFAILLTPAFAHAQWVEGTHYEVLRTEQAPRDDGRIEVLEAFWYGCPSCFSFEPHLVRWLANKPEDVEFVRVAASMSPAWRLHARTYYTAETLGVLDTMHDRVFNAIHIERNALGNMDAIAQLFLQHAGVDEETFRRAFQSFAVETQMRRGDASVRKYRLEAVPSIVVNGRYRTNPGMSRGYPQLIQLIDYLIEKERQNAVVPE